MSKVIRDCIGFGALCIVIGLENSRYPLSQSDAKLKPIATLSLAFSRAGGRLHAFTLSSHWLLLIFSSVLIGRCDYFGFGFYGNQSKSVLKLTTNGRRMSVVRTSFCSLTCLGPRDHLSLKTRKVIIQVHLRKEKKKQHKKKQLKFIGTTMAYLLKLRARAKVKRQSLHTSLVAHQAGAYPGFRSMKRLGVFLLPPGGMYQKEKRLK